jgi:hypothetical protein
MKACGGMDVWIHDFLTSALVGGEWPASRLCGFTPGYPLHRRLGGPQSRSERLDVNILDLTGIRTPTPRSSSP